MSLINDALKRAGEQQQQQQSRPAAGPELRPATTAAKSSMLVPVLIGGLVLTVSGAGWLFWKSSQGSPNVPKSTESANAVVSTGSGVKPENAAAVGKTAAPVRNAAAPPSVPFKSHTTETGQGTVIQQTPAAVSPTVSKVETAVSVPVESIASARPAPEPPQAAPAAIAAPQFPELKLQGIAFNPSHPTVMISGKTLSVGQKVAGVRVTKIEREAVTVEWNGESRQLELSQ